MKLKSGRLTLLPTLALCLSGAGKALRLATSERLGRAMSATTLALRESRDEVRRNGWSALLVLVALAGCAGGGNDPQVEVKATLLPQIRTLVVGDLAVNPDGTQATLPAGLSLRPGDVFVLGDRAYKVATVTGNTAGLELPSVADLYEELTIKGKVAIDGSFLTPENLGEGVTAVEQRSNASRESAARVVPFRPVALKLALPVPATAGKVKLSGDLSFSDVELDLDYQYTLASGLTRWKSTLGGKVEFIGELAVDGAVNFEKKYDLTKGLVCFPLPAPPPIIEICPTLPLAVTVSGFNATVAARIYEHISIFRYGVDWSKGLGAAKIINERTPLKDEFAKFDYLRSVISFLDKTTTINFGIDISPAIGAKLQAGRGLLAVAIIPKVGVSANVGALYDFTNNVPCLKNMTADAYLKAELMVSLKTISFDSLLDFEGWVEDKEVFSSDILELRRNLLEGSGQLLPCKPVTLASLSSTPNPSKPGEGVRLKGQVTTKLPSADGALPTGGVLFIEGAQTLCGGDLMSDGSAECHATFTEGTHEISIQYLGSEVFQPSTSLSYSQTVSATAPPEACTGTFVKVLSSTCSVTKDDRGVYQSRVTVSGESCGPVSSGTSGGPVPGASPVSTSCNGWQPFTIQEGWQVCKRETSDPPYTTWTASATLIHLGPALLALGQLLSIEVNSSSGQVAARLLMEDSTTLDCQ